MHLAEDPDPQLAGNMAVAHEGPIGRCDLAVFAHVVPQRIKLFVAARARNPAQGALEARVEQLLEGAGKGIVGGRQANEMTVHVVVGRLGRDLDADPPRDPAQVVDVGAGADDGAMDAVTLLPQGDPPSRRRVRRVRCVA